MDEPDIILIGVGHGGCRMVAAARARFGSELRTLAVDTDTATIRTMQEAGLSTLLLGGSRVSGFGTGGDHLKGRAAAEDDLDTLRKNHLAGVRTAIVVACLGGGTGSGVTPTLVNGLREMGVITLCFVTTPFKFEASERRQLAERIRPLIEESADSLVTLPLGSLFADAGADELVLAIERAQEIVASGLAMLWNLVTKPGFIQFDKEHLRRIVLGGGRANFGRGVGVGEARAQEALKQLWECRLLTEGKALAEAGAVIVGIMGGRDLRLAEIGEIMAALKKRCRAECCLEMGTVIDQGYEGRIELVVVTFEHCTVKTTLAAQLAVGSGAAASAPGSAPPPIDALALAGVQSIRRKARGKGSSSLLRYGASGRGRFEKSEPTVLDGEDVDVPTYFRRGIILER